MVHEQTHKILGGDTELAHYILGRRGDASGAAVPLLLREMPGVAAGSQYGGNSDYEGCLTDRARRYFPSGGAAYEDCQHVEICHPEAPSASRFVRHWRAALHRVALATRRANARLPRGELIRVHASSSDGFGNSWGHHISVHLTEEAFRAIFRVPRKLLWLATFHVTSVYTGAGKTCSENGAPQCAYQAYARGDHFEACSSLSTMMRRGICNERHEPHAIHGRYHCIFYDSTMADFATWLTGGSLSLAVAMLEADRIDSKIILDDPVAALHTTSRSFGRAPLETMFGGEMTALDIQRRILDAARAFVDDGLAEGIVPEATELVTAWGETLDLLEAGDLERLGRRLDWAAKLRVIGAAVEQGKVRWGSPEARLLDLAYTNLEPEDSIFTALERAREIDRLTDSEEIATGNDKPEPDTRAYTRGRLIDLYPEHILGVDWDFIRFLVFDRRANRLMSRRFEMKDPLYWRERDVKQVFDRGGELEDVLDSLDALRDGPNGTDHQALKEDTLNGQPTATIQ
jgi:proteasome accessory factor A